MPAGEKQLLHTYQPLFQLTQAGNKLLKEPWRSYSHSTDHHKGTHTSADAMSVIMGTRERKRPHGMYFIHPCQQVLLNNFHLQDRVKTLETPLGFGFTD